MPEAVAIDFGTSRTKLAYWPAGAQRPELLRFEWDKPFTPSLFYLARGSERIVYGANAEEMLKRDPAGIIDVLKRRLRDTYVRANRRSIRPSELLSQFLTYLRQRARGIAAFSGQPPETVYLTMPVLYGPPDEQVLREAAQQAGFTEITLIPEPLAAARAWLTETGTASEDVIVLDCGGGTIDWAYLRREGEDFRVVPACPPDGDRHVGGHDIDLELFEHIKDKLPEERVPELEQKKPYYLQRIRLLKEQYCRGVPLEAVVLVGQPVELSDSEMQAVFDARFVHQACESLRGYMAQVQAVTGGACPTLLLVGGSAQLPGLATALETRFGCQTAWWERSEFATVLGAVPMPVAVPPLPQRVVPTPIAPGPTPTLTSAPSLPVTLRDSIGMDFVLIPAGTFRMGSNDDDDEKPVHEVRLTRAFYLGKYAVTQGQWQAVIGNKPSRFQGDANRPVENVSWEEVQEFIRRLNGRERGQKYRLPTEAEWEYAARARTMTIYSFGDDERQLGQYARYVDNAGRGFFGVSRGETHPVGLKKPNPWGLYDMHGNVWEWVQDCYAADYYQQFTHTAAVDPAGPAAGAGRVERGGSWHSNARYCRSANRRGADPGDRNGYLGFRLAREM